MQERAGSRIPDGFYALLSTADGNCFFNSISILLYGTEERSKYLRLAAVIHAVAHYEHYIKMVCP